jgi:hypothetical protein
VTEAERAVLVAAADLVDHDDGEAWLKLLEAVKAWRREPKEQLEIGGKR